MFNVNIHIDLSQNNHFFVPGWLNITTAKRMGNSRGGGGTGPPSVPGDLQSLYKRSSVIIYVDYRLW